MQTMKSGNISPLSEGLQTNTPSSILMSRPNNIASAPLCSSFNYNSPRNMHLKNFDNRPSSYIGQRKSMNQLVALYFVILFISSS